MRACLSALLIVTSIALSNAANLSVDRGNIVLNGRALTRSGQDSDPVMSPDGNRIVFNHRGAASPTMKLCEDEDDRLLELWRVTIDGSDLRKLLSAHGEEKPEFIICAFDRKQFSSDGQLLYFETPGWVTSGAAHVFNFRTNKEHFVVPSNGLTVLSECKDQQYRDYLVVYQHRYFVFGGSYDWAYLFTPQGKEIGPLGENGVSAATEWCVQSPNVGGASKARQPQRAHDARAMLCAALNRPHNPKPVRQWLRGYLAGAGYSGDYQTAAADIGGICQGNPQWSLETAAHHWFERAKQ